MRFLLLCSLPFLSTVASGQEGRPPDHQILGGIPHSIEGAEDRAHISAFLREKQRFALEFFDHIQSEACKQLRTNQITGRQFAQALRTEEAKAEDKTAEAFDLLKARLTDEGRAVMLEELSMVRVSGGPNDHVRTFDEAPDLFTRNYIATCNRIDEQGGLR